MHGGPVAEAKHFSHRVRARGDVQSAPQDDVIDILVDKRGAEAVQVCSREQVHVLLAQLPLEALHQGGPQTENQYSCGQVGAPRLVARIRHD